MIDERAKRKDNFDGRNSAPVVFGDGQTWFVPKPWLEVRPTFRKGKAVASYAVPTYGPEIDALIDAIGECERLDDQVTAGASLAAYLLGFQYELTDADLDQILVFRLALEEPMAWVREVIAIATGRSGPKRSRLAATDAAGARTNAAHDAARGRGGYLRFPPGDQAHDSRGAVG